MYEVEVKVQANHNGVRSRLLELGAKRTATVHQADTYYDAPHRDFAETDEALRIRTETDTNGTETTTHLTYKGPLVDDASKTREESETDIENQDVMEDILTALGFSPAAVVEKDRERYSLDEYTVTLDTVSDLGEFLEIETERATDDDIQTAREEAFSILRDMNLDPTDQIRTSYLDLQRNNNQQ